MINSLHADKVRANRHEYDSDKVSSVASDDVGLAVTQGNVARWGL